MAEKAYYLIFSHAFVARHPDLAETIWDAIAAIKADAGFKAIVDQYMQ